jgi:hypothetical protein
VVVEEFSPLRGFCLLYATVKKKLSFLKFACGGAGEGDYNISVDGNMAR